MHLSIVSTVGFSQRMDLEVGQAYKYCDLGFLSIPFRSQFMEKYIIA